MKIQLAKRPILINWHQKALNIQGLIASSPFVVHPVLHYYRVIIPMLRKRSVMSAAGKTLGGTEKCGPSYLRTTATTRRGLVRFFTWAYPGISKRVLMEQMMSC